MSFLVILASDEHELQEVDERLSNDGMRNDLTDAHKLRYVWRLYKRSENSLKSSLDDLNNLRKQQEKDMVQVENYISHIQQLSEQQKFLMKDYEKENDILKDEVSQLEQEKRDFDNSFQEIKLHLSENGICMDHSEKNIYGKIVHVLNENKKLYENMQRQKDILMSMFENPIDVEKTNQTESMLDSSQCDKKQYDVTFESKNLTLQQNDFMKQIESLQIAKYEHIKIEELFSSADVADYSSTSSNKVKMLINSNSRLKEENQVLKTQTQLVNEIFKERCNNKLFEEKKDLSTLEKLQLINELNHQQVHALKESEIRLQEKDEELQSVYKIIDKPVFKTLYSSNETQTKLSSPVKLDIITKAYQKNAVELTNCKEVIDTIKEEISSIFVGNSQNSAMDCFSPCILKTSENAGKNLTTPDQVKYVGEVITKQKDQIENLIFEKQKICETLSINQWKPWDDVIVEVNSNRIKMKESVEELQNIDSAIISLVDPLLPAEKVETLTSCEKIAALTDLYSEQSNIFEIIKCKMQMLILDKKHNEGDEMNEGEEMTLEHDFDVVINNYESLRHTIEMLNVEKQGIEEILYSSCLLRDNKNNKSLSVAQKLEIFTNTYKDQLSELQKVNKIDADFLEMFPDLKHKETDYDVQNNPVKQFEMCIKRFDLLHEKYRELSTENKALDEVFYSEKFESIIENTLQIESTNKIDKIKHLLTMYLQCETQLKIFKEEQHQLSESLATENFTSNLVLDGDNRLFMEQHNQEQEKKFPQKRTERSEQHQIGNPQQLQQKHQEESTTDLFIKKFKTLQTKYNKINEDYEAIKNLLNSKIELLNSNSSNPSSLETQKSWMDSYENNLDQFKNLNVLLLMYENISVNLTEAENFNKQFESMLEDFLKEVGQRVMGSSIENLNCLTKEYENKTLELKTMKLEQKGLKELISQNIGLSTEQNEFTDIINTFIEEYKILEQLVLKQNENKTTIREVLNSMSIPQCDDDSQAYKLNMDFELDQSNLILKLKSIDLSYNRLQSQLNDLNKEKEAISKTLNGFYGISSEEKELSLVDKVRDIIAFFQEKDKQIKMLREEHDEFEYVVVHLEDERNAKSGLENINAFIDEHELLQQNLKALDKQMQEIITVLNNPCFIELFNTVPFEKRISEKFQTVALSYQKMKDEVNWLHHEQSKLMLPCGFPGNFSNTKDKRKVEVVDVFISSYENLERDNKNLVQEIQHIKSLLQNYCEESSDSSPPINVETIPKDLEDVNREILKTEETLDEINVDCDPPKSDKNKGVLHGKIIALLDDRDSLKRVTKDQEDQLLKCKQELEEFHTVQNLNKSLKVELGDKDLKCLELTMQLNELNATTEYQTANLQEIKKEVQRLQNMHDLKAKALEQKKLECSKLSETLTVSEEKLHAANKELCHLQIMYQGEGGKMQEKISECSALQSQLSGRVVACCELTKQLEDMRTHEDKIQQFEKEHAAFQQLQTLYIGITEELQEKTAKCTQLSITLAKLNISTKSKEYELEKANEELDIFRNLQRMDEKAKRELKGKADIAIKELQEKVYECLELSNKLQEFENKLKASEDQLLRANKESSRSKKEMEEVFDELQKEFQQEQQKTSEQLNATSESYNKLKEEHKVLQMNYQKKTEEATHVSEELREVESMLLSKKKEKLELLKSNSDLKKKIELLTSTVDDLKKTLDEHYCRHKKKKEEFQQSRKDEISVALLEQRKNTENIQEQNNQLQEKIISLEKKVHSAKAEKNCILQKLEGEHQISVKSLKSQQQYALNEIKEDHEGEVAKLYKQLTLYEEEFKSLKAKFKAARKKNDEFHRSLSDSFSNAKLMNQKVNALREEKEQLERAFVREKDKLEQFEKDTSELSTSNQRLKTELGHVNELVFQQKEILQTMKTKLKKKNAQIKEHEASGQEIQISYENQIVHLQQTNDVQEQVLVQLKLELQRYHEKHGKLLHKSNTKVSTFKQKAEVESQRTKEVEHQVSRVKTQYSELKNTLVAAVQELKEL